MTTVGSNTCQGWEGLSRWHSRLLTWQNNGMIWCYYHNNAEGRQNKKSVTTQVVAGDPFKTSAESGRTCWQINSAMHQLGWNTFMYYISSFVKQAHYKRSKKLFFLLKWSTWQFEHFCSDLFLIGGKKKNQVKKKKTTRNVQGKESQVHTEVWE